MAALLGVSAMGAGCVVAALGAGAAAGVGTYAFIKGELDTVEEVSLDRGWEATNDAVKDFEFTIKESAKDSMKAKLLVLEADKTEIRISLTADGEKRTKFGIRVGVFGDEAKSRLILEKIRKHY